MIHEEIVTYEVAKLAKEEGFNEYEACTHIYEDDDQWYTLTTYINAKGIDWSKDKFTVAPTQALLQRWLREEKKVEAVVLSQNNIGKPYFGDVYTERGLENRYCKGFDTYELALEDALKYALENLV